MESAPGPEEVADVFRRLLAGTLSREQADRWAAKWVVADEPPAMADAVWEALVHLHGCDLRHGPTEDYLHSDAQIHAWLVGLLKGTAT